jgi:ArsR family transcriptional regulator
MPKTLPVVDMSAPVCCSPVAAGPVDDEAALAIALRLKALADPVRVKLVSLLFSSDAGELCSSDLASAVELGESTVSHHLSQLRRAGLVESERRGMNVYHRPRRDALVALCIVLVAVLCKHAVDRCSRYSRGRRSVRGFTAIVHPPSKRRLRIIESLRATN